MLSIENVRYRDRAEIIRHIRTQVFQLEQNIAPELEFDGLDDNATHLLAWWKKTPVGTARLRAIAPHTGKIERLAVLPEMRRRGIGRQLMQYALDSFQQQGTNRIVLNAQAYIAPLYARLGFQIHGDPFEEAGIPHVSMKITLNGSYSDS